MAIPKDCTLCRNAAGELKPLHKSWNGIFIGDYDSYIHFQKDIIARYCHFMRTAKHRDTANVLQECFKYSNNGKVLCECDKYSYPRRKKAVERLGYRVIIDNYERCSENWNPCYFVIEEAKA